MNREERLYHQHILWDDFITRFCNSLLLNNYSWKEVSQKIVDHQLLKHTYTKFDRRSNSSVEKFMIPSPSMFYGALRDCGVPREFMDMCVVVDYVTILDILERARLIEYSKTRVMMMDEHTNYTING